MLAEFGADVIKVEHPRLGDGNRSIPPRVHGVSMMHLAMNAGVRSVAADPDAEYWPELVAACCKWADVVIVSVHGEDARRRGLDFGSIRGHNNRIVYSGVSNYGTTGPWSGARSHGPQIDAYAGNLPIEWLEDSPQIARGFRPTSPSAAAIFTALGVYAGLYQRDQLGQAIWVDVSMWASAVAWQWRDVAAVANAGAPPVEYADLGCRYGLYRTADRRVLFVCPVDRRSWALFCDAIDLRDRAEMGDWTTGSDYGDAYPEERALIQERIETRSLSDWTDRLSSTSIPFTPVLTMAEVLASDHARASGVLGSTTIGEHDAFFPRVPVHLRIDDAVEVPELRLSPPPDIGQDDHEVLEMLGLGHLRPELGQDR
jgi:crotonobetainyl-CoA:carnitine CoA-transferase CaiB-like acyl-CoA transferase